MGAGAGASRVHPQVVTALRRCYGSWRTSWEGPHVPCGRPQRHTGAHGPSQMPAPAVMALAPFAAERLKDEGMTLAAGASPAYGTRFLDAIRAFPMGKRLTSESVTALVGLPPNGSEGAVGAWMNGAARKGLIRRVGFTKAQRANQHATMISEWEKV